MLTPSAFDLLKDEGQNRTTLVVQCLICKICFGTDKLEKQKQRFLSLTKPHRNFLSTNRFANLWSFIYLVPW